MHGVCSKESGEEEIFLWFGSLVDIKILSIETAEKTIFLLMSISNGTHIT